MSLKPSLIEVVPADTARVARAGFPKGNLYLAMRDELGVLFEDNDFVELFPRRGQPAFAPWRLALITVMQFLVNLSDRQTADAVRSRIDWKYALGLKLTDSGFDYSVLSGFRERLANGERQTLLLVSESRQNSRRIPENQVKLFSLEERPQECFFQRSGQWMQTIICHPAFDLTVPA